MREITPIDNLDVSLTVPGSKSLTQRALIAASLADGTSRLIGPLESEDTEYSSGALAQMGMKIDKGREGWTVEGRAGRIAATDRPI